LSSLVALTTFGQVRRMKILAKKGNA